MRLTYNSTFQRMTNRSLPLPRIGTDWAIIAAQAEKLRREFGDSALPRFWQELERVNGLPAGSLSDAPDTTPAAEGESRR